VSAIAKSRTPSIASIEHDNGGGSGCVPSLVGGPGRLCIAQRSVPPASSPQPHAPLRMGRGVAAAAPSCTQANVPSPSAAQQPQGSDDNAVAPRISGMARGLRVDSGGGGLASATPPHTTTLPLRVRAQVIVWEASTSTASASPSTGSGAATQSSPTVPTAP
jgi:hypothetical protein